MKPREFTVEELAKYNGSDTSLPVLICVRGLIFDVSQGRSFYGPGGPYNVFAGKECARALALMSTKEEECTGDVSELGPEKLAILHEWEEKFKAKYPVAGALQGSGIDLSEYENEEIQRLDDQPRPSGHNAPLLFGTVGLVAAVVALVASVVFQNWGAQ